jgi:hypothetical protein
MKAIRGKKTNLKTGKKEIGYHLPGRCFTTSEVEAKRYIRECNKNLYRVRVTDLNGNLVVLPEWKDKRYTS